MNAKVWALADTFSSLEGDRRTRIASWSVSRVGQTFWRQEMNPSIGVEFCFAA